MNSTSMPIHDAIRVVGTRRGSSWPVAVETRAGRFVTKLRGAAQGVPPLIAEVVVAELATRLGLPVPERAVIRLPEEVPTDDARDELADLLARSAGDNLGFRLLDGATDLRSDQHALVAPDVAAKILWLDSLVENPDRTASNPNILVFHRQPWLIDHGAALPFQYDFAHLTEDSPRTKGLLLHLHLFASALPRLAGVDAECAALLTRADLTTSVATIPEDFLVTAFPREAPDRMRAAYVAFLWKRLKAPRPFLSA